MLPGVGPLTAGQLSDLLGTGEVGEGTGGVAWRRLLTDPVTGTLTDLAQHRYRPSAQLERTIRARDVTCRFPGCRRSATSTGTDLDHCTPWPAGPTQSGNLVVLCRRHHRLKHQAGWSVAVDVAGAVTWTTPSGRRNRTEPWQYHEPAVTDLPPDDPLGDGP